MSQALDPAALFSLHGACARGDYEGVLRILEAKADVNAADPAKGGRTPMQITCGAGHLDMAKLLLAAGADVDKADEYGVTSLYCACNCGHLNVVKMLLEHGADKDNANRLGAAPLHQACVCGHLNVVKVLLAPSAFAAP